MKILTLHKNLFIEFSFNWCQQMLAYRLNIEVDDKDLTLPPPIQNIPEELPVLETCQPSTARSPKKRKREETKEIVSDDQEAELEIKGVAVKKRKVITNEVRELLRLQALGDKLKTNKLERSLICSLNK